MALIAEQHCGALGGLARGHAVLGGGKNLFGASLVDVGMLKEAEADLCGEDTADGLIDLRDGDLSAGNCCGKILPVSSGTKGHLHIDAGLKTAHRGVGEVFRVAM